MILNLLEIKNTHTFQWIAFMLFFRLNYQSRRADAADKHREDDHYRYQAYTYCQILLGVIILGYRVSDN